jgi:hypothetical protein
MTGGKFSSLLTPKEEEERLRNVDGCGPSAESPIVSERARRTADGPLLLCISEVVVASTPLALVVNRVKFIVLTRNLI